MPTIIYLIAVIFLNLVLKSIKDKKEIEKERRKRIEELRDTAKERQETYTVLHRKEKKQERIYDVPIEEYKIDEEKTSYEESPISSVEPEKIVYLHDQAEKEEVKPRQEDKKDQVKLDDLKKDLIRGIIVSEILSEPKSIKNIKRSM